MNSKSTLVGRYILILITFTLSLVFAGKAQTVSPKLKFIQPKLISGVAGKKNAIYKFSDVISGVDAFVKISDLVNGAILKNIDDSTIGYYEAWQPTVGGPSTYGTSYIKWEITFKSTEGATYKFPLMDLSAIDIDGDNARVREFIDIATKTTYDLPNSVPSLLKIMDLDGEDNEDDDDNDSENQNGSKIHILGPVINRLDLDTVSLDVRINLHFNNVSKIKINTGSQIDNNGTSGGVATDRYNSLYFKSISNIISTLGVTYRSFEAYSNKNTEANLFWITENEINNDHFEVQRSFDQLDFQTVGLVFGPENNTSGSNKYSFIDKAKDLGSHPVVYYRLKQIDIDGKYTYSVVKTVRFNTARPTLLDVYPNPYVDKLNVSFSSDETGKAEIRMINARGQVVVSKQSIISNGYNNLQLTDLSSQAKGLYVVDVIVNGKLVSTQKIIKR